MEDNFEDEKEKIKDLYKDMDSIVKMNPQLYIMPNSLFNSICGKITRLERDIRRAREGRDNWKLKYKQEKRK